MIKLAFTDFWNNFNGGGNFFTSIFKKMGLDYSLVDIENADYLIYASFGYENLRAKESCIKIFYTGENICPDFNLCDYAIGFERMQFGDRYLRYPLYLLYEEDLNERMEHKHLLPADFDLKKDKPSFCSFTVSNAKGSAMRKKLFDLVNGYKKIDSGGRWMNNIGGPVSDKFAFDSQHKFSLVCENSRHSGYATEKIVQAFAARTVPIYWGDPDIAQEFNPNAFIDASQYSSHELVEKIRQIDENDEMYLDMLRQPALASPESTRANREKEVISFMENIFRQTKEDARRYNRDCWGKKYIDDLIKKIEDEKTATSLKRHIKIYLKNKF